MARHKKQSKNHHTKHLPKPAGVRLPFTLNQLGATGVAPTTMVKSMDGEVGRTVVWNWNIPHEHWKQNKVPFFLTSLFCNDEEEDWEGKKHKHSWFHWWHCHKKPVLGVSGNATFTLVQELTNKQDPLTVYNLTPGTLATVAWIRLDLSRPEVNKWYTLAEVEFYESVETAGSARLHITALVSGAQGNLIATTETLTNGAWASATLTGGYDEFHNLAHGTQVTISPRTYTFVTGAFSATGQVAIGTTGGTTLLNFIQAIIAGSGAGVAYATGTTAHPYVTAEVGDADGSIKLTGLTGVAAATVNAVVLTSSGALGVSGNAFFHDPTMTGGVDGIYYADPGFSFTSIVSALDQGAQGLEVQVSSETAELFLPDLRNGLWEKAEATVSVVNWASPSGGIITLFGGRVGKVIYDNTAFITLEIDNQMSRDMQWPAESWSPTCRAQLGDARCKFDIESMSRTATISAVVNSTEIRSQDLGHPADYWQNGIIQILDGDNAGQAVELLFSDSVPAASGADAGLSGAQLVKAHWWGELKVKKSKKRKTGSLKTKNKRTYYNPENNSTLTLDGKVYTFKKVLTTGDGAVKINGKAGKGCKEDNQEDTLENLRAAINLVSGGAGVQYGTATVQHTTIRAGNVDDNRIEMTAKIAGSAGNAYVVARAGSTNINNESAKHFEGGKGTPTTPAGTGATSTTGGYDTLIFAQPFPFPLTVGTTFKVWPGCQKRFIKDCRDRYHNTLNFRGEPFAPTKDGLVVQ